MRTLAAFGAALIGLTWLALGVLMPWSTAEGLTIIVLVGIMALSVLVWLLAAREVLHRALPRRAIWIVLIVAMAIRLPVLLTPPLLSSDIYRYVWDGRVQEAGINPYRFVPADPALAALRDADIYPNINRASYAHTIYPPAAQFIFAVAARISPTVLAEKIMMSAFEALAIFCGLRLLALARLPPERVLIYAWNPLAVWAFACDGHVDAAGIGLLACALLLRCLRRYGAAGAVFGAAVLIKFLPVAVGPALWRRDGGWRLTLCALATILVLYACYASVGWRVLGFLPGYRTEEGLDSGNGIWLLAGLRYVLPESVNAIAPYGIVVALTLGAFSLWIMSRRHPPPGTEADVLQVCGNAAVLAACVTAAISPHYPWYYAWLALPAIVAPFRSVLWLSAAPVALYLKPLDDQFVWPALIYVPAVLLAVADFRRARRPVFGGQSSSLKGIS